MAAVSDDNLRKSLRHVYYELWMLFSIGGQILDEIRTYESKEIGEGEDRSIDSSAFTHTSPPPQIHMVKTPIPKDIVSHNAQLEAFGIHMRALFQFFFPEEFRRMENDIVAEQFFDDPEEWKRIRMREWDIELRKLRDRVGQEIAHITSFRKAYPVKDKDWPVRAILKEIATIARRFLDVVPSRLTPADWSLEAEINEVLG